MKTKMVYEAPETFSLELFIEQGVMTLSDGSGNVQSSNVQSLNSSDIENDVAW